MSRNGQREAFSITLPSVQALESPPQSPEPSPRLPAPGPGDLRARSAGGKRHTWDAGSRGPASAPQPAAVRPARTSVRLAVARPDIDAVAPRPVTPVTEDAASSRATTPGLAFSTSSGPEACAEAEPVPERRQPASSPVKQRPPEPRWSEKYRTSSEARLDLFGPDNPFATWVGGVFDDPEALMQPPGLKLKPLRRRRAPAAERLGPAVYSDESEFYESARPVSPLASLGLDVGGMGVSGSKSLPVARPRRHAAFDAARRKQVDQAAFEQLHREQRKRVIDARPRVTHVKQRVRRRRKERGEQKEHVARALRPRQEVVPEDPFHLRLLEPREADEHRLVLSHHDHDVQPLSVKPLRSVLRVADTQRESLEALSDSLSLSHSHAQLSQPSLLDISRSLSLDSRRSGRSASLAEPHRYGVEKSVKRRVMRGPVAQMLRSL